MKSLPTLSRRTLLRGAKHVAIALPFLDAMAPRKASAAAKAPKRLLTLINENGVVPTAWFPGDGATEKTFTMGPLLKSWLPIQQNVIMIDGLDNKAQGGTCHAAARCGTLTGANNNGGRAVGASIDQVVANTISAGTPLKSLETSVFLKGNFIYGLFFSGPGQMVQPIDDPAETFARVFSMGVPSAAPADPAAMKAFEQVRARKLSILDHALGEYKRLSGTVGTADQMRLQRHMDGIREIERGLMVNEDHGAAASCKLPAMPAALATGLDFPTVIKLQSQLVTMALACDLTRVASIQTRASLTAFTWLGVTTAQHPLSHQQGSAGADVQLNKIQDWFAQQFFALIEGLRTTADTDGQTLFDNTLVFWTNDLGRGTHARQRYPFMLATGKFTLPDGRMLETGRYLKYPSGGAHNDLLASIAKIMGVPNQGKFGGYGNGPLPNLG